jgi:hypothetical protein
MTDSRHELRIFEFRILREPVENFVDNLNCHPCTLIAKSLPPFEAVRL